MQLLDTHNVGWLPRVEVEVSLSKLGEYAAALAAEVEGHYIFQSNKLKIVDKLNGKLDRPEWDDLWQSDQVPL